MSVDSIQLDSRCEPAGPNSLTPNQQLAHFALLLVNRSSAATDDQTQAGLAAVKAWLRQIASGEVVVGRPVQPDPAPAAKVKRK